MDISGSPIEIQWALGNIQGNLARYDVSIFFEEDAFEISICIFSDIFFRS